MVTVEATLELLRILVQLPQRDSLGFCLVPATPGQCEKVISIGVMRKI
jgi:hypothetical protein